MHAGLTVLHVEDDAVDARMTRRALERLTEIRKVHHVPDGLAALSYLRQEPPHAEAETPHLVLMDFHLPGLQGDEILEQIQLDLSLRHIPIIVLSGENDPNTILKCYRWGARAYVEKPKSQEGYARIAQAISQFWMAVAALPKSADKAD